MHDLMNWMDLSDIVSYFNQCDIDFLSFDNIETVIQCIYDKIETADDALEFAFAFKRHVPTGIIVARVYSVIYGRMMTLMDALLCDSFIQTNKILTIKALEDVGFKYAMECNTNDMLELHNQYLQSKEMAPFIEEVRFLYDYETLQHSRSCLHEEMMQYLFHPDRIEKWINSGNQLEAYLN
jgi:hypothetical protein